LNFAGEKIQQGPGGIMTETKPTIGRAIDQIVEALGSFDEKDRKAILNTVCQHLGIEVGQTIESEHAGSATAHRRIIENKPPSTPTPDIKRDLDIRTLKDQKGPTSARQMACLVAYYLQESAPEGERKDSISRADLEKYFKQAKYKLPTKLEQLLVDCKAAGISNPPNEENIASLGLAIIW
jgi:hypothetical protein